MVILRVKTWKKHLISNSMQIQGEMFRISIFKIPPKQILYVSLFFSFFNFTDRVLLLKFNFNMENTSIRILSCFQSHPVRTFLETAAINNNNNKKIQLMMEERLLIQVNVYVNNDIKGLAFADQKGLAWAINF